MNNFRIYYKNILRVYKIFILERETSFMSIKIEK